MSNRLDSLQHQLLTETVLAEWFAPMQKALDRVRYSRQRHSTLSVDFFILLGCLRQLQGMEVLRELIQSLFDLDTLAERVPLARSTWSDALANRGRRDILRAATQQLVLVARNVLPDRFADYTELGARPLYALDATYQTESSHYRPVYPRDGGTDNSKGHMALTTYDLRSGIAVDVATETASIDEMRFVKEGWIAKQWTCQKQVVYVVDRAFIEARYWDQRKLNYQATVITRMKSVLKYEVLNETVLAATPINEGVIWDKTIQLNSSKQNWRLIQFLAPDGKVYEYLSNDFTLLPGTIAFLYHRRWDEEKYFDNYKTDLANTKAWGKSPVAVEQQALLGLVTHLLTRLFLHKKARELGLEEDHYTQQKRHQNKAVDYIVNWVGNYNRAFFTKLSKITKQVWRFLKNSFHKRSHPQLFERKLRPILVAYL